MSQSNPILGKINDYTLLDIIGQGSSSLVYLAESPKKEKFALKIIKINNKKLQDCIHKVKTYMTLNHPNIVKAREYFLYKEETQLVIIFQYCPDGQLSKLIGQLNQKQCQNIMKQIVLGLTYIHSKDLAHRDIRPENILMVNGVPKLADFGLTKFLTSTESQTKIGSPFYMAPEVQLYQKQENNRIYLADVWSVGIVFFELLLGKRIDKMYEGNKMPYLAKNFPPEDLLNKIENKKLKKLIYWMLQKDTKLRLSSNQVLQSFTNKTDRKNQQQYYWRQKQEDFTTYEGSFYFFKQLLFKDYKFFNLKKIKIPKNTNNVDQEVKALTASAGYFPNLEQIDCEQCKITDHALKALAANVSNLPNLEIINFSNNQITDQGVKALAAVAGKLPNLTEINFHRNNITDEGAKAIFNVAQKLSNLTKLNLGDSYITDEGVKALANVVFKIPNLIQIDLSSTQITDEGVKALVAVADKLSNLIKISVGFNRKVTDEALKSLVAVAGKFPNLETLYIGQTKITDKGIKALAKAGDNFPNLQQINLNQTDQVTDEGIKALTAAAVNSFKKLRKIHVVGLEISILFWNMWLSDQKILLRIDW